MDNATLHQSKSSPLTAVVVDDSPATARAVCSYLTEEAGINVVGIGRSGADGIQLAQAYQPDLLLLDLFMPGMSGLHVISAAKERSARTRIIVLTVLGEDMDETCRSLGADGFIVKNRLQQSLLPEIQRIFSAADSSKVFSPHEYRIPEIAARR